MDPAWPDDAVEVGRILGPWGVKGWIKVQPFSIDPQALFSSKRWHLLPPQGLPPTAAQRWPALLKVTAAREHGDGVVATVQDVADRSAAEALKGGRLFVSRASFPTAPPDEYYWVDLIGCTVVNREGQDLGEVIGLIETGPQCVLRLRPREATPDAQTLQGQDGERLIPFVQAYVDTVDLAARRIVVDWGLDF